MRKTVLLAVIVICGFAAQFGLSRYLETNQTPVPPDITDADLYFKGETLKKISLGFDGLIADYYWISSLQYVGNKMFNYKGDIQVDNLEPLNPRLLYPMLDTATTLDPDFKSPYTYGSVVLPAIDVEQAIKISEKGVNARPDDWQMYHHLAYIHWKNGNYQKAAELYRLGSTKPDAPEWVKPISLVMEARGSSREVARQMYRNLYETAPNETIKKAMYLRLIQIDSFDEQDAIRSALNDFQTKNNRCASNWRELFLQLRAAKLPNGAGLRFNTDGNPLDPTDVPYLLINQGDKCDVALNGKETQILID